MAITTAVLGVLLALLFLGAGVPKITGAVRTREQASHLGVPGGLYRIIGVLEVLGAIGVIAGLWVAWLGIAAGVGLALLMLGATGSHLRVKDPARTFVVTVLIALVAAAYAVARALA